MRRRCRVQLSHRRNALTVWIIWVLGVPNVQGQPAYPLESSSVTPSNVFGPLTVATQPPNDYENSIPVSGPSTIRFIIPTNKLPGLSTMIIYSKAPWLFISYDKPTDITGILFGSPFGSTLGTRIKARIHITSMCRSRLPVIRGTPHSVEYQPTVV